MKDESKFKVLGQRIHERDNVKSRLHCALSGMNVFGSQQIAESIIENSGALVFVKDRDGVYQMVNREWEEVSGYRREDVIGKSVDDLFSGETVRQIKANDSLVLESEKTINLEEFLDTSSGRRYYLSNKFPLFDNNGVVVGMCGIASDITASKQTEEALRQSEMMLQKSQSVARIGSYCLDINSDIFTCSSTLEEIFGVDESVPRNTEGWMMIIHPQYREEIRRKMEQEVLVEHKRFDLEYRIVRPVDGKIRWIHGLGELEFDEKGDPQRIIGTIQDITERKQADASLVESEIRFKALHNASFGGIAIHDKGIILECNKGLSELTGYSYEELIGMNGLLLITEESREVVLDNINSGYEKSYEVVGLRKNGECYPIRLEARNIPYKGKMVRVVEFRDLTEIKLAEKEKGELEKKLLQSQKMESVGRLAGGVAHDFNNMLSVIIGHAELALNEIGPDQMLRTALEEIKHAGQRSADLTRQLLAFARQQTILPRPIDLNQSVSGMIRMLQRLIGEDVELVWLPGKNVWSLKLDPCQIDQVLANLCVNARDAIEGVGKIMIETGNAVFNDAFCKDQPDFMPGEYVYIAVSDTGCGMGPETKEHVFEPFFTTKAAGQGTGLGLATVYGVVKQNNGFVDVCSEPEKGTMFKLYFPRYHDPKSCALLTGESGEVPSGTGTILLVEDEPAILRMTSRMLKGFGYQVFSASAPKDAISLARQHGAEIDLLITDVVMPEMNGRDLVEEIKTFYPGLRWLFISGYTANVIAQHGVLDEGVNFIQKPFSRADLADKVRAMLVS